MASASKNVECAIDAEQEPFDAAAIADVAYYLELAECENLAEEADYQADFYRHSGHDPGHTRLGVYDDAIVAIATALPCGYALPTSEELDENWHLHRQLARDALRNICAFRGDAICALVGKVGDATITIEAAVDSEFRCGLVEQDTPVHVFRTDPDGGRDELTLLVPDNCEHYTQIAWLLDAGAAVLAEDHPGSP